MDRSAIQFFAYKKEYTYTPLLAEVNLVHLSLPLILYPSALG
jgi:hypothetical protein